MRSTKFEQVEAEEFKTKQETAENFHVKSADLLQKEV